MMSRVRPLALLALAATGLSGRPVGLAAQVAGLPVRNAGIGTGIGIAADVGFPNAAAGKGTAFGATGALGAGPLGVTASVSRDDPKGSEAFWSVGGTANLKVFGGPLIPVSVTLQAGAARTSQAATSIEGDALTLRSWHVPVGVGLALTIPNPAFSIKPWLAPRLDLVRTTQSDGGTASEVSHTDKHFGISGGVDLGFLSGLSVRVMYDRLMAGGGVHPSVLSLGLGLRVGT
jgi:outer membrane protein with beta-barrel domain